MSRREIIIGIVGGAFITAVVLISAWVMEQSLLGLPL